MGAISLSRESLVHFYEAHNPAKLANVDTIAEHIAQGRVSVNQALDQCFALYGAKPVVTKAKGALIKLDIGSNSIAAKQEGDLQRICMASGIELATHL
jgi:hypothetical protein